MAFFDAYLDESGTHNGAIYTTVAGAIAKRSSWYSLETQWQAMLRKFNVKYFHATDLNCFGGEYREWKDDKRREFFSMIFKILKSEPITPIAISVNIDIFNKVKTEFPDISLTPYQFCCEMCLREIVFFAKKKRKMNPVSVIFEAGQKTNSLGLHWIKQGLSVDELVRKYKISGFSFHPKGDMPALQIADLIAYELNHGQTIISKHGLREIRYPLNQIVTICGWAKGGTVEEDSIRKYIKVISDFIPHINKETKR